MRCRGDAHRSDAVKRTLLFRKVCPPDLPPGTKQRQRMHCRSAGRQHFGKMLIFRMPAQVRVGNRMPSMVSVESIGEKGKTVDSRLRRSPCGNSERGLVSECCAEDGSDSPLTACTKAGKRGYLFKTGLRTVTERYKVLLFSHIVRRTRLTGGAERLFAPPQQNRGFITPGQIKGMAPSVDEQRGAIPFFEFLFAIGY